jgi:hypothetical protein
VVCIAFRLLGFRGHVRFDVGSVFNGHGIDATRGRVGPGDVDTGEPDTGEVDTGDADTGEPDTGEC